MIACAPWPSTNPISTTSATRCRKNAELDEDNQPYGHAYLDIDNLAYDNFAYKHSTIGEMSDLNAASVDDVKDFFRIYYAPNNAALTLVGDLDPAETLEKVKKYFGDIPSQPTPPPVDMTEPPHYGERREIIYDPLARTPLVLMAYHIPPGNTPGNDAIHVFASVLAQGKVAPLSACGQRKAISHAGLRTGR